MIVSEFLIGVVLVGVGVTLFRLKAPQREARQFAECFRFGDSDAQVKRTSAVRTFMNRIGVGVIVVIGITTILGSFW